VPGVREIAAANQLVMLTQRIAKNASALLLGDAIDPEIAFLLGKDTNTFRDTMTGAEQGQ
jgi:twitching motility protein PilJ